MHKDDPDNDLSNEEVIKFTMDHVTPSDIRDPDCPDTSIEEILQNFEENPFALCKRNGKIMNNQTAVVLILQSQGQKTNEIARSMNLKAKKISKIREYYKDTVIPDLMNDLGLSRAHIVNTIFEATLATKPRHIIEKGSYHGVVEEPDYATRLTAAKEAAKLMDLYSPDKIEVSSTHGIEHHDIIGIIRKETKIEPGKFPIEENQNA